MILTRSSTWGLREIIIIEYSKGSHGPRMGPKCRPIQIENLPHHAEAGSRRRPARTAPPPPPLRPSPTRRPCWRRPGGGKGDSINLLSRIYSRFNRCNQSNEARLSVERGVVRAGVVHAVRQVGQVLGKAVAAEVCKIHRNIEPRNRFVGGGDETSLMSLFRSDTEVNPMWMALLTLGVGGWKVVGMSRLT